MCIKVSTVFWVLNRIYKKIEPALNTVVLIRIMLQVNVYNSVLTRVKSKNPLLGPFLNFCKKELMRPIIEILILFKRSRVDLYYVKNLILHLDCMTFEFKNYKN